MSTKILSICVVLSAAFLLSSCATVDSVSQKFTPKTKANIGIFTDQTISMLSSSDFGFNRNETLYTREFFNLNEKEEQEVRSLRREADEMLTRVIKYSLALVQIAETKNSSEARVAAYHEYAANMNQDLLEKLGLEADRYDDIKQQVAQSEDFLQALQAAQPIINASGRYAHQILDRGDVAVDVLVDKLDKRIDEEYAEVIRYQEALEEEKYNILRSLAYLYGSYKGNMDAYALLVETESIHRKDLIADPPPSDEDLSKIAEFLQKRLSALHIVEKEIQSDWDTYRAAHRELDDLHTKAKRQNAQLRLTILIWLRAHQKMSSGISSPAEWFDIKSLPSTLINTGVKAAF